MISIIISKEKNQQHIPIVHIHTRIQFCAPSHYSNQPIDVINFSLGVILAGLASLASPRRPVGWPRRPMYNESSGAERSRSRFFFGERSKNNANIAVIITRKEMYGASTIKANCARPDTS